jgi:hypothetical protein
MVISLVSTVFFSAVLVGWLARSAHEPRQVVSWSGAYGVEITERNRPMITYYVQLTIILRVIGGVAAIDLGQIFDWAFGLHTTGGLGFWIWVVLGWLAGAAWAEHRLTRPDGSQRAASLTPRRVTDYLSRWLFLAPAVTAAATTTIALVGLGLDRKSRPEAGQMAGGLPPSLTSPDRTVGLVAAIVGAALIAAFVSLIVRSVVARRQPVTDPALVAADDAIRSSAVHHIAGAGTAAILLIAAHVTASVLEPYHAPFGLRGWVPIIPAVGAVVAWRFFAHRGWLVHRADAALST